MGMLAWVMMGLALWHFTIWLPDRYWGGIVGAFIGALIGAAVFGLIVNGFSIPGRHATDLLTAVEAVPGALIGIALVYFEGARRERAEAESCDGRLSDDEPADATERPVQRPEHELRPGRYVVPAVRRRGGERDRARDMAVRHDVPEWNEPQRVGADQADRSNRGGEHRGGPGDRETHRHQL